MFLVLNISDSIGFVKIISVNSPDLRMVKYKPPLNGAAINKG